MWVGLDLEKNAKLWVVADGYEELMETEKVLSRLATGMLPGLFHNLTEKSLEHRLLLVSPIIPET